MIEDFYNDNLDTKEWIGSVVDNADPDFDGKVRVRVFGKFDDLEDDAIPWATPCNISTGGSKSGGGFFSVPKKGSLVNVVFENGDLYHPKWKHIYKHSDDLISEIKDDYEHAHSIIYDTEIKGSLKIYYVSKKGLMIEYNGSMFNMKPDKTIVVRSGTNGKLIHIQDDKISLGKEDKSKEPVTLADTLESLLNDLLTDIGNVGTITTSSGVTATINTSPQWSSLVAKYKQKWKDFKSEVTSTD